MKASIYIKFALLLVVSCLGSPATHAASQPKIELVVVKSSKPQENCFGSFYVARVDLSKTKPNSPSCGLHTLINQEIAGTRHFQFFENGKWIDLESSEHWIMRSPSFQNSKNVSTYSEKVIGAKLKPHNFGKLISNSRYKYLNYNKVSCLCVDWLSLPKPYNTERVISGYVYNPAITELRIRAKVISGNQVLYSNPIDIIFQNHDQVIYGKDGTFTSAASSGSTSSSGSNSGTNTSKGTGSSNCSPANAPVSASLGSDDSQGYSLQAVLFRNSSNCNVVVSAAISVVCPNGGVLDLSLTARTVGNISLTPGQQLGITGLNLNYYFPQAIQDCYFRTGFRANLVQISTLYGAPPSARVVSATP